MVQKEGTTIIKVTHSMYDAGFAHRIVNLLNGEVLTENLNERLADLSL